AAGTQNKGIFPYALAQDTVGNTIGFATVSGTNTIVRQLAGTEFTADALTANNNIVLSSNPGAVSAALSINSLDLQSGGGVTVNPLTTLTLLSGGLIARTGNTGISGGVLTAAANDLIVHTLDDMTIASTITGTGGLTKAESGNLTLTATNSVYAGMGGN